MKRMVRSGISPRAAAAVLALALLAPIVTGRERPDTPELPLESQRISGPAPVAMPDLPLEKLTGRQRAPLLAPDLFASHSWAPPAPPPPIAAAAPIPQPPRAPVAPALPFSYLGSMTRGEQVVAYLLRGQQLLLAEVGQEIDGDYHVERISDSSVDFVYLPLGTKQSLNVPTPP